MSFNSSAGRKGRFLHGDNEKCCHWIAQKTGEENNPSLGGEKSPYEAACPKNERYTVIQTKCISYISWII
jgi:hypothetical protein